MKRYLLFAGQDFYPAGGWKDFRGDFDTVEECLLNALKHNKEDPFNWFHIIDIVTKQIVHSS